ncbi:hypothetical protein A3Q56_00372 [Intoshia linei]|uniref:G-protein coupled receptors family 1 profile domain-containing protein n=1 Tax=Intoshia linei TaxID=1819745 RepID=A0A177BBX5_9BILA|nr:hypothetical protein A3Q56_00372 [Intoshia linei]
MWHYAWAHFCYHVVHGLPKPNQYRMRILIWIIGFALLPPQFLVLYNPQSVRYCKYDLFSLLVVSIVLTMFSIGFSIIFTATEPINPFIVYAFMPFSFVCFLHTAILAVFTFLSPDCFKTVYYLYQCSYYMSIFSMVTTGFYIIVMPFWLVNYTLFVKQKNEQVQQDFQEIKRKFPYFCPVIS